MAVNPDIDYVVVRPVEGDHAGSATCWRRRGSRTTPASSGEHPEVVATVHRRAAARARRYTPPFHVLRRAAPEAHQVLGADYVTTEDGTGVVHIAPAFGEEDKLVSDAAGIEPSSPVDEQARFTAEVPPYAGTAGLRRQQADHDAT